MAEPTSGISYDDLLQLLSADPNTTDDIPAMMRYAGAAPQASMPRPPSAMVADASPEPMLPSAQPMSRPSTNIQGPVTQIDVNAPKSPLQTMAGLSNLPPGAENSPTYMALMSKAMDRRNSDRFSANVGDALSQGIATMTNTRPNTELYKGLRDQADQPVADAAAMQKLEQDDPNSPSGQAFRQVAGSMLKKNFGVTEDKLRLMPTSQIEALVKMGGPEMLMSAKLQAMLEAKRMSAEAQETKADSRAIKDQSSALDKTISLLESARGNPAAAQAERDIYAADKAKSLANLYGDPNKLSSRQVNLLVSEIAKIAQGGVPSIHELEGLTPSTLAGQFSRQWEKLTNSPTAANAAAFVKQYQDYSDAVTRDARKVIEDKYGRVIESRRGQLSDADYQKLQDQYMHRFKPAESTSGINPRLLELRKKAAEGKIQ